MTERKKPLPDVPPSSNTLAESYKPGTTRKRLAKLRSPQEAWTLAVAAGLRRNGFGAISNYPFAHIQQLFAKSWLRSRYWGGAIALNSAPVDDLPDWDDLPADVKHFFKLLHLLNQPGAQFFTIRLDPSIGERALAAARGPADWLADKIKRALESVGVSADQIAFALEFAPKQARTLHRLHIHGALCVSAEMLGRVAKALVDALAPEYKHHGTNAAIKLEAPAKVRDVAKYVVKESGITKNRLIRLLNQNNATDHPKGANPHRASTSATAGGRMLYNDLRSALFSKQEAVNKTFLEAIRARQEGDE